MRSDALANQRKIVEAATRLMAEQGLEAELTDIAHEAGVGVGTVYRCVGNRDQVIEDDRARRRGADGRKLR